MSITIGLARKDLITYRAYIFRFRLEEVQNGPRPETQELTAFMIVVVQLGGPVRDAEINKGRKGDRQCPALSSKSWV
jgi:hypothetical protein